MRFFFYEVLAGPYFLSCILGFFLVFKFIIPLPDLLSGGGDANSIWLTISTFKNVQPISSYVLYKGFLAVYPYVWLRDFAITLGLNDFFFIKVYHALLFSFVAGFGIPKIISNVLNIKINLLKNIIFVFILFNLFQFTNIFHMLMTDLPSWAFFVLAILLLIKFVRYPFANANNIKGVCLSFIAGIFVGLTLCASGQYFLAGILLIIYFFKFNSKKIFTYTILAIFISGVLLPKIYDKYFMLQYVKPMTDRGEWIPSGKSWFYSGLTRVIHKYKYGYPDQNNRGLAILKSVEQENFSNRLLLIGKGGGTYSVPEYLNIIKSYPLDFFIMWTTKLFIALSFDGGAAKIKHLLVSYTSLFICFYLIYLRCRRIDDLVKPNAILILSIISSATAPVIIFIDMRNIIALMGFILGFAIHQEDISIKLSKFDLRSFFKFKYFFDFKIRYPIIVYIIFIIACFTLYGSLLEISGSDPHKVLFKW